MISIVMAYRNRKELFLRTLKSIKKSSISNYEIIIVDDASSEEHRLEDVVDNNPFIKLIRVNPEDKWWINPCVTYNLGLKNVNGDIVIIQNPECYHYGDILKKASILSNNEYYSFSCYSLDEETSKTLNTITINNKTASRDGDLAWYNHSVYRPKGYHFCSAITRKDLVEKMNNGFDETYANGIGYDDDDFLLRIKKSNINISIIDDPFVFHQWHESIDYNQMGHDGESLLLKNKKIFENKF